MAFDYEAAKAKYGAAKARQMQAAEENAGGNQAIDVNSFKTAAAPGPVNLGAVSAVDSGIQDWGAAIGSQNRQTADMSPEQRARWAQEHIEGFDAQSKTQRDSQGAFNQWMAWDDKYDSACPPNTPYRGRAGQCAEKPDDCPSGTTLHGSSCVPHDQLPAWAGGNGGAGAAAPGAAGAPGAPGASPAYFGQDDPLQRYLTDIMSSRGGSFTGTEKGGAFQGGGVWSQAGQVAQPAAAAAPVAPGAAAPAPVGPVPAPAPSPASSALQAFGGGGFAAGSGGFSDPYEANKAKFGVQQARQMQSTPSAALAPMAAPVAPVSKPPDAFGIAPQPGSLETLVDPRRQRRDARTGGSWF